MAKTYLMQRPADHDIGGCRATVITASGERPLKHIVVHSPTGLEWGYGGSGPADLALSILVDYFGERPHLKGQYYELGRNSRAWALHQNFKWHWIARLPHAGGTITSDDIRAWVG